MEKKHWSIDLITLTERINLGHDFCGKLTEMECLACGAVLMYERFKNEFCGAVVYDENDGRLVPKILARIRCFDWTEEIWQNAILKERRISMDEYAAWQDAEIKAQKAAIKE